MKRNLERKNEEAFFYPERSETYIRTQPYLHYIGGRIYEILSTVVYDEQEKIFKKMCQNLVHKYYLTYGWIYVDRKWVWLVITNSSTDLFKDSVHRALIRYIIRTENIIKERYITFIINKFCILLGEEDVMALFEGIKNLL